MSKYRYITCFLSCAILAAPAAAREPGVGNTSSQGASIGLPTGANPPQGLWFNDISSVYQAQSTDYTGGDKNGAKITAISTTGRLLWTSPWHFLGATEMAFVVLPFVNLDVSNIPGEPGVSGHRLSVANPEFVPINLSWHLGVPGLFGSTTFGFYPPIGPYDAHATANVADNFWTFQPEVALSYISENWLASAHLEYTINTQNPDTHYRSGDQIFLDLTALHEFGKWQAGPVGYYTKQVTADQNNGTFYGPTSPTFGQPGAFAPGLLVGRKFGKAFWNAWFTHDVVADQGGTMGTRVYFGFMLPLN